MAVVFILFTLAAQLTVGLVSHQAAEAAVASAARAASLGRSYSSEALLSDLRATVPGARRIRAGLSRGDRLARAWARFEFVPPGPLFGSLEFSVDAEVPVVVSP